MFETRLNYEDFLRYHFRKRAHELIAVLDSKVLKMTNRDILSKLRKEMDAGITTEVQVVYFMAGIRKIIERDKAKGQYPTLNFHCDWTLHSQLHGDGAKAVLRAFDAAQPHLLGGTKLGNLPRHIYREIERIFRMETFETELLAFFAAYGLPNFGDADAWLRFQYLYANVVQDIPLVIYESDITTTQNISKIIVQSELAREPIKIDDERQEMWFKVTWTIFDKSGNSGDVFIINGFDYSPV